MVTSSTIMLQDKPWASVKDKDGIMNFNFTGVCNHPSQQKPSAPPPPCKAVISLGEWEDFSESMVGNNNALLVQSTIPCMTSGQDLQIIDSGQQTGLEAAEPRTERAAHSISSIELLRGDTAQAGTVVQYVNIKRDAKYVDGTNITELDSLGQKLRLKVKFDKPGRFKFKVKLTLDNLSNAIYSSAEKSRNPNFKYSEDEIEFSTDSNGEKIIDANKIFVTPAGGDIFTVSAKDEEGNEVTAAAKVKTARMMYYVEAKMNGLTSIASNLSIFTGEYNKHEVLFNNLPDINIAHICNIGSNTDSNTFKNRIKTAYASTGQAKDPYCIIIGYTDHLAVKEANKPINVPNVTVGNATPVTVPIEDSSGKKYSLWNNIVPGEGWFVECYFIKDGGTNANKITIDESKCTAVSRPGYASDDCEDVNIDVSSLPAETGTITLKVNWVNKMRAGLSFNTNIVAICTRSWWRNKNNSDQCQTIIHEVGHQLEMVPNPSSIYHTKKLLDKGGYHYDDSKGRHVGDHCHYDIAVGQTRYDSATDRSNSKCVMYGSTNGKSAFCVECAKAMRKVDLAGGVKI
jgi:hypothetical protein